MHSVVREFIPSMFQRRLWLLIIAAMTVCAVMLAQITRLSLVQGASMRIESENALSQWKLIPTIRGRILDTKGRVLAEDRPSDDIAVNYRVITGEWAYLMAKRAARASNVARFIEMSYEEREKLIASYQPAFDAQVESLWKTLCEMGRINRAELERRKAMVKERVQQISSHLMLARWSAEQRRREQLKKNESGRVQAWLPDWLTERTMELADADQSDQFEEIREEQADHPLLQNVDNVAVIRAKRLVAVAESAKLPDVWSQVSVISSKVRAYPLETVKNLEIDRSSLPTPLASSRPSNVTVEGLGLHVLGILRDVWKEDVQARPFNAEQNDSANLGGYLAGDLIGAWGVERSQEAVLRGARGRQMRYLDTQKQEILEPVPGRDITLTLDIALQARVQAIMEPSFGLMKVQPWQSKDPEASEEQPMKPSLGEALNGAAVVLDVSNGDVLAMVSTPGISLRQLRENPDSVWNDQRNSPFTNRAIARGFQPGSTVKVLVLNAAVTDKRLLPGEEIVCTGHYYEQDTQHFRCWIYKAYGGRTHGPLTAPQAIMRSCNIFFNTLGDRLGADRLVWWYGQFGLGSPTNCGLHEEIGGSLPKYTPSSRVGQPAIGTSDAINMSIGQGPMLWTPMQAANAYATVARGGVVMTPRVVKNELTTASATNLHLSPKGLSLTLEGLFSAVNERDGTANHLSLLNGELIFKDLPNLKIYGKSGTAAAAALRIDSDRDGRITSRDQIVRQGDHAWCIVMLQRPSDAQPRYIVAVVVEYGGSGGAVAGPVVSQIIHAMRQEGYL